MDLYDDFNRAIGELVASIPVDGVEELGALAIHLGSEAILVDNKMATMADKCAAINGKTFNEISAIIEEWRAIVDMIEENADIVRRQVSNIHISMVDVISRITQEREKYKGLK